MTQPFGANDGPPARGWRWDLALSLLFLAVVLATGPNGGIWARHVPIPWGGEQTNIAHALASGGGFADPDPVPTGPTAWVPPVWPATLALIYRTCGLDTRLSSRVIILLQHLLAAFALFALLRCSGPRPTWAKRLCLLAAFVVLAYPPVHLRAMVDADDFWIVWALLASLMWLCTAQGWSRGRLLGFSVLGGLAVLTHAGAGLAFLVTAGVCVYRGYRHEHPQDRRWHPVLLRRLGIVYLGAALALAGWGWRNYARFHELIPVKSNLWFELGLTLLPPGNSGILTESDLLLRHPLFNRQVNAHMAAVGEAGFMASQRRRVLLAVRRRPGVLARQILHRAVNALVYAEPVMDAARVHIDLPAQDWARLQTAGLVRIGSSPGDKAWLYLGKPVGKTLRYLASLPLEQKPRAVHDWIRAESVYQAVNSSWRSVIERLLFGLLPTLCLAWGFWRRHNARVALLPYASLAYAAGLTPHILISDYFLYQLRFVPLQAGLFAGVLIDLGVLAAAGCRRTPSRPTSETSPVCP